MKKVTLKNILIAVCALGLAIIATTTATMIAGLKTTEASIGFEDSTKDSLYARYFVGGDNSGRSQTNALPLFGKNGINKTAAIAIMQVIETMQNTPKQIYTAEDFSNFAKTGTSIAQGGLYIRLFEPVSIGVSAEASSFTQSNTTEKHGEIGQARWWRAVYMKNDVLTLWMADGYRNSPFYSSSEEKYGTCIARTNILKDYDDIMQEYGMTATSIINTAIVKNNNPEQGNTGNGKGEANYLSNPAVPATDHIWLPSGYEVFNTANDTTSYDTGSAYTTTRAGLWKVNGYDRAYAQGGFREYVWLRSDYLPDNGNNTSLIALNGCYKTFRNIGGGNTVRPAIHIDLAKIQEYGTSNIQAEIE